jgi:hypothetical protein
LVFAFSNEYRNWQKHKLTKNFPKTVDKTATTIQSSTTDLNSTYLKAAQVYDDGSRKAKYFAEAIREDEGISPPGHYD